MITSPTIHLPAQPGPLLFADCPFCLAPLPVDLATGAMDCEACAIHLELATDLVVEPARVAAVAGAGLPELAAAA